MKTRVCKAIARTWLAKPLCRMCLIRLTPLRSIAVDRTMWAYGLPFWIDAVLPWADETPRPFRRLMIAQDTGSAIVGAARADLYFGSGDDAGACAGAIRHRAEFIVLLPQGDEP